MDRATWTRRAAGCALAAGCVLMGACAEMAQYAGAGALVAGVATGNKEHRKAAAVGAAAVGAQMALSAPSKEEKAAKEAPGWVAVAESLTPAQRKAAESRFNQKQYGGNRGARDAWFDWKRDGHVESGDYAPEVHADVLRVFEEVRETKIKTCFQWNPPDLERRWERRAAGTGSLSTAPRTDGAMGEALLEKFAASRMSASWARYREAREKAEQLEKTLREEFPQGKESDPSGGEIFERTKQNGAKAVAEMFRRHDELCFFFLMKTGGVFSDAVLKKLDGQGGAVWLEGADTGVEEGNVGAIAGPKAEDAAFAESHLAESWRASRELAGMHDSGAAQYRKLAHAARVLDAARAGSQLALFRNRLAAIREGVEEAQRQFGILRFQHKLGELAAAALEAKDREMGAALRTLAEETSPGRWVSQKAKMGVLELPGGETMDFAWCPPGTFQMGSPATESGRGTNEEPHAVDIPDGFWMAKHEVTKGQWASVMGLAAPNPQNAAFPVAGATGDDISKFCDKSMLALPTEEEWEYACRAGTPGPYGGTGTLAEMGWFAGNSDGKLHPAGMKNPNAWGLYDMHGNVWEWCEGEGIPLRGGSFRDQAETCRAAFRDTLERRLASKAEEDMNTMLRRMREEGIDEIDLERGIEYLPPRKREALRRLYEEGVMVNPLATGQAVLGNIGFRPVWRGK